MALAQGKPFAEEATCAGELPQALPSPNCRESISPTSRRQKKVFAHTQGQRAILKAHKAKSAQERAALPPSSAILDRKPKSWGILCQRTSWASVLKMALVCCCQRRWSLGGVTTLRIRGQPFRQRVVSRLETSPVS